MPSVSNTVIAVLWLQSVALCVAREWSVTESVQVPGREGTKARASCS